MFDRSYLHDERSSRHQASERDRGNHGVIGNYLCACSLGALMDIASMRSDMDDSMRATAFGSKFAKAPFPAYLALTTIVMLGTPAMLIWMLNA